MNPMNNKNSNSFDRMRMVVDKLSHTSFALMPAFENDKLKRQGGLMTHCLNLWMQIEELTGRLNLHWDDPSSPFVIAMLHHACNIGRFFYNHERMCWEQDDAPYDGHGTKSIQVAERLGIELTEEEKACILYHMGDFSDSELYPEYAETIIKYPNVLWVHTADMLVMKEYGYKSLEVDYAG